MKRFYYSPQMPLYGKPDVIGFGDESFRLMIIPKKIADDVIIRNHYSGKIFNGSSIHFGIYNNDILIGVLQFGPALNHASGHKIIAGTTTEDYLELNRMWVDDCAFRNTESRAISYAIKIIKAIRPKIKWIQSFADERCGGLGIVYQAANFKYYGEHIAIFWELDGIMYHNIIMSHVNNTPKSYKHLQQHKDRAIKHELRQFRYIYFIDQRQIKNVLLKECPYPKHYLEAN